MLCSFLFNRSFEPILFTTIAFIVSSVGSRWCYYLYRTFVATDYNYLFFTPSATGQSFGIWGYELNGSCHAFPNNMVVDRKFTASMVFSTWKTIIGAALMMLIWWVTARGCSKPIWCTIAGLLFLNSIFEGLVLLLKTSMLCDPKYGSCSLDIGAKCGMAAVVFWFIAGISVFKVQRPAESDQSVLQDSSTPSKRVESSGKTITDDLFKLILCRTSHVPFGVPFD